MKKRISMTVFAAVALTSGFAAAEQLGDNGTFAIGVDRIFGYVSDSQSYESAAVAGVPGSKYETTVSEFSFLGRAAGILVAQVPRLSFDAFLGPGVSFGGSIMYEHFSTTNKVAGVEDPDKPSTGIWLISPRVGFAHMFTPEVGIWPRAGIMYAHTSSDSSSTNVATGVVTKNSDTVGTLYYTMDVNLVVTPVPHIGFTIGPTLDYLLSYSSSRTPPATSPSTNQKELALGIQAGFLGWF